MPESQFDIFLDAMSQYILLSSLFCSVLDATVLVPSLGGLCIKDTKWIVSSMHRLPGVGTSNSNYFMASIVLNLLNQCFES